MYGDNNSWLYPLYQGKVKFTHTTVSSKIIGFVSRNDERAPYEIRNKNFGYLNFGRLVLGEILEGLYPK